VTELLGGFAGMVRAQAVKKLETETALVALLTFLLICSTWIDAWNELKSVNLDLADLWAPILLATCYYLAAAVVFPREPEQYSRLRTYLAARKLFVFGLLWAAVLLECYASSGFFTDAYQHRAAYFWGFLVPYNFAVNAGFLLLLVVRERRASIALVSAEILLVLVPYWQDHSFAPATMHLFGY